MSKWLPIITNDGIMYFFDKSTGTCQWTYPKIHDSKQNKYVNVFFQDWSKIKYGDKIYWLNRKSSERQNIKPWSTTYIFEACYLDNFAFVELYLEYNGNVNVIEKHGKNCLHYAVMNDNDTMTKMIIGLGCEIDHKDLKGLTPLIYCVTYRSYKCLKVLIEEHCEINSVDLKNNCILHYAVKTRNHKLILFLVKSGARMDIKNKKGDFPVDIALKDNNWTIVNLITKLSNIERVQRELEENNEELFNEEIPYDLFEHKSKKEIKGLSLKNFNKLQKVRRLENDKGISNLSNSKLFKEGSINDKWNSKSNRSRLSIDEINFSRDTISNLKENNRLKIKDAYEKDPLFVIEEEDLIKSKKERIKKYKALNTSRLSTQSTLSSLTNSFVSAMKDYVYPSVSSVLSIGYTNARYYLGKFYSSSVAFTKVKGAIAYHYLKTFIHNARIYFKSPPDIENQIEYLTYLEDDQHQILNFDQEKDALNNNNKGNKLSSFNKIFNQSLSYLSIEELKKSSEYDQLRKSQITSSKINFNYTIKRTKTRKKKTKKIYVINLRELLDRNGNLSLGKYYHYIHKFSFDTEFIKLLNKQPFIIKGKSKFKKKEQVTEPTDALLFIDLVDNDKSNQKPTSRYSHDIIKYQISKIQTENAMKVPNNSLEVSLKLNLNDIKDQGTNNPINNNNRYDLQLLSNRSYGKCYDNIVQSIENMNFILDKTNLKAKQQTNSMRNPKKTNSNNRDLMVLIEDEKWDDFDLSENNAFRKQRDSFNDDDNQNEDNIDIEDILLEYNKKLKQIKSENGDNDDDDNPKEEDNE